MFRFEYTKNAARDLRQLDRQVSKRILKKMDFFSKQEDPLKFATKLTDPSLGEYRFRVGDYRVLFDIDKDGNVKILMVLSIKHRREAYLAYSIWSHMPPSGMEAQCFQLILCLYLDFSAAESSFLLFQPR
jgi:mRNA interferase RelE/StbE